MWEWCIVQWIEHSSYVGVGCSSVGRSQVEVGVGCRLVGTTHDLFGSEV